MAGWGTVRDVHRKVKTSAIMQRRDNGRWQKKFGTALAPTANEPRWDIREAYRTLFAVRVDADRELQGGAYTENDGDVVGQDPLLTPEYEDILTEEWKIRHNHFSSKLHSNFTATDDHKQARREREEMWEKLRRKFRMLR